jgi:hypothetical protein
MTGPGVDTPFHRFQRAGANAHQLRMIAEAVSASPELNRAMTEAMRTGRLASFRLLPPSATVYGEYDPHYREIRLHPALFGAPINQESLDKVVDVLAHETRHALQFDEINGFDARMLDRAQAFGQSKGPREWTAFVGDYIAFGRRMEALAELDGINTLADRIRRQTYRPVTEPELARRLDATSGCVERTPDGTFRFKPGVTFDPATQSVRPTPENLAAIARCHFDANPHYRHHYAASAMRLIADRELALRADDPLRPVTDNRIDLARLGLDAKRLRAMPMRLAAEAPFEIVDISDGRSRLIEFRGSAPRRTPELHEARSRMVASMPADAAHPDHALWVKLQDRVRELDRAAGKGWDEHSERLLASALVMAKANGFGADDELRLAFNLPTDRYAAGEIVHLWRDRPTASPDPAANRTHMSTREALAMPAEERYRQLEVLAESLVQTREPARDRLIPPDAPSAARMVMGH